MDYKLNMNEGGSYDFVRKGNMLLLEKIIDGER